METPPNRIGRGEHIRSPIDSGTQQSGSDNFANKPSRWTNSDTNPAVTNPDPGSTNTDAATTNANPLAANPHTAANQDPGEFKDCGNGSRDS